MSETTTEAREQGVIYPIGMIAWVTGAPIHDPAEKLILMYLCTGPAESDNPNALYLNPNEMAEGLAMTPHQMLWHIESLQARGWLSRFFVEPTAPDAGPWWVMLLDPRRKS